MHCAGLDKSPHGLERNHRPKDNEAQFERMSDEQRIKAIEERPNKLGIHIATSGDQNVPLNLPTKRRLCSTVGGRIVDGWAAHCCAVSTARSRAATMTNLARSSLALALPALFGATKSCALVNRFMICPDGRLVTRPADDNQILPLIAAISWHVTEHGCGLAPTGTR